MQQFLWIDYLFQRARRQLVSLGVLLLFISHAVAAAAPGRDLYVAPWGNDAQSGTLTAPLATLEGARDTIRRWKTHGGVPTGGVRIYLRGGCYQRAQSFTLTAEDAGTDTAPITYQAYLGETPRLVGGRILNAWTKVTDPKILQRLEPHARGQVRQCDLQALGITDLGWPAYRLPGVYQTPAPELFCNGQVMTLARWPHDGFLTIREVPNEALVAHPVDTERRARGTFFYTAERPQRWQDTANLLVYGYLTYYYADMYLPVAKLDVAQQRVAFNAYPGINEGMAVGHRFYFLNVLEEVTRPGDYFIDRHTGMLYFWPPAGEEREIVLSTLSAPVVSFNETAFVTLQGLMIEGGRGAGVEIIGGHDNLVAGCTLRNLGLVGVSIGDYLQKYPANGWPDSLQAYNGGAHNGVVSCEIYHTGQGGLLLAAGDRARLTAGDAYAVNNEIWDFSRALRTNGPGIALYGVGNHAAHNRIHDMGSSGIYLNGNDHQVAYNELYSLCHETGDVGSIYMAGNFTFRGNVIRHNYIHDLGGMLENSHGSMGIYLDDWSSGQLVEGNLLVRVQQGLRLSGGRDAQITNNLFVDCRNNGVVMDGKGLWPGEWQHWVHGYMKADYARVQPHQPPYSTRYPALTNLDQYYTARENTPVQQDHNTITRNVSVRAPWDISTKPHFVVPMDLRTCTIAQNIEDGDDTLLVAENGRLNLRADARLYQRGITPLPVQQMGLYRDAYRTALPAQPLPIWSMEVRTAPSMVKPGVVEVTVTNVGNALAQGAMQLTTSLPETTRLLGTATQAYAVPPGQTRTYTWQLAVTDPNVRQVSLGLRTTQHGAYLYPCWQTVQVAPELSLVSLPGKTSQRQLPDAVARIAPLRIRDTDGRLGDVRVARVGEALTITATVYDATITRPANFWEGSSLECFFASAQSPGSIRQFVFLPPADGAAAEVRLYMDGERQPDPAVRYTVVPIDGGYQVMAQLPLALLEIPDTHALRFEIGMSMVDAISGKLRTANLFGSYSPYRDSAKYGTLVRP